MALLKCYECGNDVSSEAKSCPKCGAKVKSPKKPSSTSFGNIIIGVVVGVVLVGLIIIPSIQDNELKESSKSPAQLEAEAVAKAKEEKLNGPRYACVEFVRKSLHDPDSAEFDDTLSNWAEEEIDGVFHVQVNVKAKNGLNAYRKIVVNCRTKMVNSKWIALRIEQLN